MQTIRKKIDQSYIIANQYVFQYTDWKLVYNQTTAKVPQLYLWIIYDDIRRQQSNDTT